MLGWLKFQEEEREQDNELIAEFGTLACQAQNKRLLGQDYKEEQEQYCEIEGKLKDRGYRYENGRWQ